MKRMTAGFALVFCLAATPYFTVPAASQTTSDVQSYGAKGDCSADDWWAFQKGMDDLAAHGGGTLTVPPPAQSCYRLSQALRMRSNVNLLVTAPTTEIHCTGDRSGTDETGASYVNGWPFNSCAMFGSGESNNLMRAPTMPIATPNNGDTQIQLSNSKAATRFAAGDLVLVEAKSTFLVGKTARKQTWLQMDLIASVDGQRNQVTLAHPFTSDTPITGGMELRKLTNTKLTAQDWAGHDTHVPLWASSNSSLVGGTWIANHVNAAFTGGGGGLDCTQKPSSVVAAYGVGYSNLLAGCQLSVSDESIGSVPLELAWGSHDNAVSIGTIEVGAGTGTTSSANWFVALDEGARDNAITIDQLKLTGNGAGDMILLDRAAKNTLTVNQIMGASIAGNVINLRASAFQGTPPSTALNHVSAKNVTLDRQKHYVYIMGSDTKDNTVDNSNFLGALTASDDTAFVVWNAGQGNVIVKTDGAAGVDAKRWRD